MQLFQETIEKGFFSCSVVYSDVDENSVVHDIKDRYGRLLSVLVA